MRRTLAIAVFVMGGGWALIGCSSLTPALPCNVTIVALPPNSMMTPGDPLPPGSQVLAAPNDFDRTAITIVADTTGNSAVNLELQGDAIARVAAHTAGHAGEFIAIAINGTVVAVPMIQGPLMDGTLQITGAGGDDDLAGRFAGCVS